MAAGPSTAPPAPLPLWRQALLKVPEGERCGAQRDLVRAMELVDYLTEAFEEGRPMPAHHSDNFYRVALALAEALHLPIKDRPTVDLMPSKNKRNLDFFRVGIMKKAYSDEVEAATHAVEGQDPTAAGHQKDLCLAILQLTAAEAVEELETDTFATTNMMYLTAAEQLQGVEQCLSCRSETRPVFDAFLIKHGCHLTLDDLIEKSRVLNSHLLLLAADLGAPVAAKATAGYLRFLRDLETRPLSWYGLSHLYSMAVLARKVIALDEQREMCEREEAVLRRHVAAAKAAEPSDPLREGWASLDLALLLTGPGGWQWEDVEKLLNVGQQCILACMSWLPPMFRKKMNDSIDMMVIVQSTAQSLYPRDYCSRRLHFEEIAAAFSEADADWMLDSSLPKTPRGAEACAACGRVGTGMSRCVRCRQVKYCDRDCQKWDWKRHKKVCKAV